MQKFIRFSYQFRNDPSRFTRDRSMMESTLNPRISGNSHYYNNFDEPVSEKCAAS